MGDLLADASEADDTEHFPAHLGAEKPLLLPPAVFHGAIGSRDRPRERQHQRARVLSHADAVGAGSVHDENAARARGVDVDVVHTRTGARDDPEIWR